MRRGKAAALRGSSDFTDLDSYRGFIAEVVGRANAHRTKGIEAERAVLLDLPVSRTEDCDKTSVNITSSSGFVLRRVFYTVPSRLIGHRLGVHIYDDRLELFLSSTRILTLPRGRAGATGPNVHVVNYRHVIHSLKKKPMALLNLVYRDTLFPREAYRRCFETALERLTERQACRHTVALLALAHEENCEAELAAAIDRALKTGRLPDDIAALKAMVLASRAELRNRDLLIEKLKHQLAGLRRQRFGTTSEALDQLDLGLEDEEIARAAEALPEPPPGAKRQPKRRPLPEHLAREETVLTPGEQCTDCGGSLKRVGEDVTEEWEYIPGRFVVKRIVRPRLACRCCERFHQAPLPPRPIERGRPGPGLLAHVLVAKYCDHLPLYRQSQIFARDGVELDRSTLAGWVGKATALLEPLAEAIGRHVLAGQALFADDTPVKVLAPGTGKTSTGRVWTYVRDERPWKGEAPPAAWYRFSADRKAEQQSGHWAVSRADAILGSWPGLIVAVCGRR